MKGRSLHRRQERVGAGEKHPFSGRGKRSAQKKKHLEFPPARDVGCRRADAVVRGRSRRRGGWLCALPDPVLAWAGGRAGGRTRKGWGRPEEGDLGAEWEGEQLG